LPDLAGGVLYDRPQPCFVECSTSALNAASLDSAIWVINSSTSFAVSPLVLSSVARSVVSKSPPFSRLAERLEKILALRTERLLRRQAEKNEAPPKV
jgi:hypothetical protein